MHLLTGLGAADPLRVRGLRSLSTDPAPGRGSAPASRRGSAWWRRVLVPGDRPRPLLELLVIGAIFGAYKLGRIVAAKHVGTAFDNAYVVWDLERLLRLPDELAVQGLLLHSVVVTKIANVYYAAVHFPATAMFLIWLYLRRPGDYLWVRRTLALLTLSGLLVHLAIPVAPPRMLTALGFVDTADRYGPAVYGPPAQNTLADQYAAMPSLHIGWAIMIALGIIATTRTRWRWLALLHPVATTLVVIGTANHYWLDGMVASGLLAASLIVVRSLSEPRIDVPDFVPVLASPPRVQELPTLPSRLPPPAPRRPTRPAGTTVAVASSPGVPPALVAPGGPGAALARARAGARVSGAGAGRVSGAGAARVSGAGAGRVSGAGAGGVSGAAGAHRVSGAGAEELADVAGDGCDR